MSAVLTYTHIKDTACVCYGLDEGPSISAATPNMEADANDIQPQLLGTLQKAPTSFYWGPELYAQTTNRLRVICGNTQHQSAPKQMYY